MIDRNAVEVTKPTDTMEKTTTTTQKANRYAHREEQHEKSRERYQCSFLQEKGKKKKRVKPGGGGAGGVREKTSDQGRRDTKRTGIQTIGEKQRLRVMSEG